MTSSSEETGTTKKEVFTCDQCEKTFTTKQNLLKHERTKKYKRGCKAMTYECKACMKKFAKQFKIDHPDTYKQELKERFTFEYKGRLDTHIKSKMHNDKPRKPREKKQFDPADNQCLVCYKQFDIRESYLQHMRDHQCPVNGIGKIYRLSGKIDSLIRSMKKRSGEDESEYSERNTTQSTELIELEEMKKRHQDYYNNNKMTFDTPKDRCDYITRVIGNEERKKIAKQVNKPKNRKQNDMVKVVKIH